MRQYRAKLCPLVKEFLDMGCSTVVAAKYLNCSDNFIRHIIKEFNLERPHKGKHNYCSIDNSVKGYKHSGSINKRFNILVYETYYSEVPKGWVVHHLNHDKLDNRPVNLLALPSNVHTTYHKNCHKEGVETILTEYLRMRGEARHYS